MAGPGELSLENIRHFMLEKGGRVTNHELVKHFKDSLTNEETKGEARDKFKEYVNVLANVKEGPDGKFLVLKTKYYPKEHQVVVYQTMPSSPSPSGPPFDISLGPFSSPSPSISMLSGSIIEDSPSRAPPPYRPPPPPVASPKYQSPRQDDPPPPPVPPRRRSSSDKGQNNKENFIDMKKQQGGEQQQQQQQIHEDEPKISVKERTQKFNLLASESEAKSLSPQSQGVANFIQYRKKSDRSEEEEHTGPLDAKDREWIVKSAQSDYQTLAKLAAERPSLTYLKDPYVTALHWAAKNGNENIIKMIAGNYKADVNARTGMTPLHLAMQFGHEDVYNLLVHVYKADPNIRDFSGKKARQYLVSTETEVSADTFRKIKSRKKQSEKELGFLRIGSLNVRVKKTTEAVSNFLMGSTSTERLHKTWGSADNIQEIDRRTMPPPKSNRRRPRRSPSSIQLKSTNSVPLISVPVHLLTSSQSVEECHMNNHRASTSSEPPPPQDSDSDTACGFGDNWKV